MYVRNLYILVALLPVIATLSIAQSLREQATTDSILIGAAVNAHYFSEADYVSALSREFNLAEPEDAMKWKALRPDVKTFDFGAADRIVEFARSHNMKVRGHNLVWGTHNPAWLTHGGYKPQELSDLLRRHISVVVGHFRGKVFAWDVVNEAFDEQGHLRDSIWLNHPGIGVPEGTAYIAEAFRWAHEADPAALLFYNESEAETINPKSDAIYVMVKAFREHGVPIDGIGFQMHIFNPTSDFPSIAANFSRFTQLGVQIHITEMDVAIPVDQAGRVRDAADLQRQAEIYRKIAQICLQTRGCTAIQTWGVTDKYSWLGWATHKTKGAGLLLDRQYRQKPAYHALIRALTEHSGQSDPP
jgi:endo-1,4-beta-xylanase